MGEPWAWATYQPTSRLGRLVPRVRQNLFTCSQLSPREDELVAREVLKLEMVAWGFPTLWLWPGDVTSVGYTQNLFLSCGSW